MKNIFRYTLLLSFAVFYNANAQQVTKKDTIGNTPLTVTMDSKVNSAMENIEENCILANSKNDNRDSSDNYTTPSSSTRPTTRVVPNRPLTNAEICRQNPRILGYKIQLTVVKSNEEANEVKAYFRRRFPSIKVLTDASLRPNYKILAGSYINKQSAAGDLARIREFFKSALPVQYMVFCVEAK